MLKLSANPRVSWLRGTAVVTVLLLLALCAPLATAALEASWSLFTIALLTLSGFAALHALPTLFHRLELRLLHARTSAVRQFPLEQLQSELLSRSQQVEQYRKALATIYAQTVGMQHMLDERRKADPTCDLSKQVRALDKMKLFHATHARKLQAAVEALAAMRNHLEAKRFEWSFACAGQEALRNLRNSERAGVMRELLSEEAARAVQLGFDEVFAELELELHALRAMPALETELA